MKSSCPQIGNNWVLFSTAMDAPSCNSLWSSETTIIRLSSAALRYNKNKRFYLVLYKKKDYIFFCCRLYIARKQNTLHESIYKNDNREAKRLPWYIPPFTSSFGDPEVIPRNTFRWMELSFIFGLSKKIYNTYPRNCALVSWCGADAIQYRQPPPPLAIAAAVLVWTAPQSEL